MTLGYVILAYLCGSIPFGVIFAKRFSLGDVRKVGSGNIGATNVLRTGNKFAAFLTLLGDLAKGWFPVWLYVFLIQTNSVVSEGRAHTCLNGMVCGVEGFSVVIALAAILGHVFPVWLKFKGGKGVATALGSLLALSPLGFCIVVLAWLVTFLISHISSLSSLVAFCFASPIVGGIVAYSAHSYTLLSFSLLCAGVIFVTHLQNIRRLLSGNEGRIH